MATLRITVLTVTFACTLVTLSWSAVAAADDAAPVPATAPAEMSSATADAMSRVEAPHERYQRGLFFRVGLGGGYAGTAFSNAAVDMAISGFAPNGSLQLGAFVVPGLAVHAGFTYWQLSSPELLFDNGDPYESGTGTAEGFRVSTRSVEAGLTKFFGRSGAFLGGSIGWASMDQHWKDADHDLDMTGVQGEVFGGWERAVSSQVGLGGEAFFAYHSVTNDDISDPFEGFAIGLRAILTLN